MTDDMPTTREMSDPRMRWLLRAAFLLFRELEDSALIDGLSLAVQSPGESHVTIYRADPRAAEVGCAVITDPAAVNAWGEQVEGDLFVNATPSND